MEIKKEDLVRIRNFQDIDFLAFPMDFFDEKKQKEEEVVEEVVVELTEEELATIAKEEKITKLKAELEELEIPEV